MNVHLRLNGETERGDAIPPEPAVLYRQLLMGLIRWLGEEKITVYHSVPTLFRTWVRLLDGEVFPALRWIKLGGETITVRDVAMYREHFGRSCKLYVGLGATEMNTIAKYVIDTETELGGNVIPVGYPPEGTEILILDENGQPVTPGETGEIVIRSPYLFRGYWRSPRLTATVLTLDGGDGVPSYRTGDLGGRRPDGSVEHLGRRDFQVKIAGNRVEVSEIELLLLRLEGIKEAVVVGKTDDRGEQFLVAYVVGRDKVTEGEIGSFLRDELPAHMIPSSFVFIDALPLTANGKVDRLSLPEAAFTPGAVPPAPRSLRGGNRGNFPRRPGGGGYR